MQKLVIYQLLGQFGAQPNGGRKTSRIAEFSRIRNGGYLDFA